MTKYIYKPLLVLLVIVILNSCGKNDLIKSQQKPSINVKATGGLNSNFNFEGKCTQVFAMYSPADPSSGFRFLNIQGVNGNKTFSVVLYWTGAYPSNPQFDLNQDTSPSDKFGIGQYIPDINNPFLAYQTGPGTPGSCTITNYDQTSQTVSGTFQFTANLNSSGNPTGTTASFSGDFTNIPINDMTDPNSPKGPCFNSTGAPLGGGPGGGGSTSTVTFINSSFTPMNITFNSQTKTANAGASAVFTGAANSSATGTATTSGKTTSGTQVGLLLTWTLGYSFPTGGSNLNVTINVNSDYFFLKMKNLTTQNFQKVYVNYGLANQTLDNVSILNNGSLYNLGYYRAFTNSNVRAESSTTAWTWNSLNLPFINNQSVTVQ